MKKQQKKDIFIGLGFIGLAYLLVIQNSRNEIKQPQIINTTVPTTVSLNSTSTTTVFPEPPAPPAPKFNINNITNREMELIALGESRQYFNVSVRDVPIIYTPTISNSDSYGSTNGIYVTIKSGISNIQTFRALSHEYCHVAYYQKGCNLGSRLGESLCESYSIDREWKDLRSFSFFGNTPSYYQCLQSITSNLDCLYLVYQQQTCEDSATKKLLHDYCNLDLQLLDRCLNA